MKDKICLVTGGSSGVGKATAMGLARLGANVIITSRNEEKANQVLKEIITKTGNANIHWMFSDLSTTASIQKFVSSFAVRYDRLHILSNNAGLIQLGRKETSEGIEKTLAIDYLSHFVLSNLLLNLLQKGVPSRIITVSGNPGLIHFARIYWDDIQLTKNYNGIMAALQAARARVIFSMELARRIKGTGITSNTFHPGHVKTAMGENQVAVLKFLASLVQPFLSSECKTAVYLASAPELENISGKFFKQKKAVKFKFEAATGKKLWEISEELTGTRFEQEASE